MTCTVISAQAFEFHNPNYLSIALPRDECGAALLKQHALAFLTARAARRKR
jgi:hypothetical protein